jgi:hypothetical protein
MNHFNPLCLVMVAHGNLSNSTPFSKALPTLALWGAAPWLAWLSSVLERLDVKQADSALNNCLQSLVEVKEGTVIAN